jgi:rubrerythrin
MIEVAKEEGDKEAEMLFRYALESEKIHAQFFKRLLDTLETPQEDYSYYICDVCGHTTEREPPEICPVCNREGEMYRKID